MQCPKCGSGFNHLVITMSPDYGGKALDNARAEGQMEVDQCLSCNGIWFDANELNEYLNEEVVLIDSPAVPQSKDYNRQPGVCPKCQKPMQMEPFKNVVIDRCPVCQGVWLDGGLLNRLEGKYFGFADRWRFMFDKLKEYRSGEKGGD